jgi:hypothetical protein
MHMDLITEFPFGCSAAVSLHSPQSVQPAVVPDSCICLLPFAENYSPSIGAEAAWSYPHGDGTCTVEKEAEMFVR